MGFHLKVFVPALSCLFNGEFTCSLHKSQNLQVYSSFYLLTYSFCTCESRYNHIFG